MKPMGCMGCCCGNLKGKLRLYKKYFLQFSLSDLKNLTGSGTENVLPGTHKEFLFKDA
jgi:hypothetical protein